MRTLFVALGMISLALVQSPGLADSANPREIEASEVTALQALFPQQTVLDEHTFRVDLPQCGTCIFVPVRDIQGRSELSLNLVDGDRILYSLPKSDHDLNWASWDVLAVAFTDVDSDGSDDLIVLAEYMTGIGPEGAIPFPTTAIYYSRDQEFVFETELSQTLTDEGVETLEEVLELLDN